VGWTCGTHGGEEVFTGFWLGGPKVRDHGEGRWEDNIKMDLIEIGIDVAN
jgi:hypothetical protein